MILFKRIGAYCMIKEILLITLFVFVNCIIIVSAICAALNHLEKLKENKGNEKKEGVEKKYINFYLIGENYATYEAFCQVTLNLEGIRDISTKINLSEDDKNIILKNFDLSLMELQTLLYDSQIDIPDPTILTKSYFQKMIIKILELRVLYESLIGNSVIENVKDNCNNDNNVLNLFPKKDTDDK